ncbi:MAG: FAD-binding oxidoreductase, partial [Elusimicrobiaceae bacterium]|nr:FAD-binding oxidoreductase [Elusimicrobiaceae bacterium]
KAGVYSILPEDTGTLGGLFCGGTLPPFYSHVLGVEALLPDGSYVRYGGKLMKNAAGYPLTRLFAGSQGTLGLITQLTFKVFARKLSPIKPRPFYKAEITEIWSRFTRTLGGGLV